MTRPLAVSTILFCLGIFFARTTGISFLWLFLLALILLTAQVFLFRNRFFSGLAAFILIFLLGALSLRNAQAFPKNHISNFLPYRHSNHCIIEGYCLSQPDVANNNFSFVMDARKLQVYAINRSCSGKILARVKDARAVNYGDKLRLRGQLSLPKVFNTRNKNSYAEYLQNSGISALMNVESGRFVICLGENNGFWLKKFSFSLKDKMKQGIFKYLPRVPAGVTSAMILGEKSFVPALLNQAMTKSGTVHVLVVSGFNVAIVSFLIIILLRIFRVPRRARIALAIPLLIIYCFATGASNPVVRATVMAIIFLSAYLVKRDADIYTSCALAALFILIINPNQLFDIGFQLSFMSVIAIVYLYPKLEKFTKSNNLKPRILKFMVDGFLVSLAAWAGTIGIIAYNFRIISAVTVLANIFIVPLATLITLSGFSLIFFGPISANLAYIFAQAIEFFVALLVRINLFMIHLPGAYFDI